jgi:hypothetical protein
MIARLPCWLGLLLYRAVVFEKLDVVEGAPIAMVKNSQWYAFPMGTFLGYNYSWILRDLVMHWYLDSTIKTALVNIQLIRKGRDLYHGKRNEFEQNCSGTITSSKSQLKLTLFDVATKAMGSEKDLLRKCWFPESVSIDPNWIITRGNSFGGMIAFRTAFEDDRVNAALTLDPWSYCKLSMMAYST